MTAISVCLISKSVELTFRWYATIHIPRCIGGVQLKPGFDSIAYMCIHHDVHSPCSKCHYPKVK